MRTSPLRKTAAMVGARRANVLCALLLIGLALFGPSPCGARGEAQVAPDPAIAPYVSHLETRGQDPLEYVLDLYRTHDVVVLAERDHRELTQWEFIYRLLEDPRFNSQVGHLFTEYGSVTQQGELEAFVAAEKPERERILGMLRNFVIWPDGWNRNNLFTFMERFHGLNKRLDRDHRITWHFSDIPWKWDGMTKADYQAQMRSTVLVRDEVMAGRIRAELGSLWQSTAPRKKALVVMNTRHAFRVPLAREGRQYGDNVGSALDRLQPTNGRTAWVMFNYVSRKRPARGGEPVEIAVQDGKWDAAFAVLGNKPRAVSFHDSPFGKDAFDYLGFSVMRVRYQDVFDGMIFWEPLERQRLAENIPGFYDGTFREVVRQRALLNDSLQEIEKYWADLREHPERFEARPAYASAITAPVRRWLRRSPGQGGQ